MGLPSDARVLDNLASTTADQIYREMSDQFFPTNPLVMRLLQLEKSKGGGNGKFIKERGAGVQIKEGIIYAGIPGDSYDDADTFNSDDHEFLTQFKWPWRHVYVPINANGVQIAQNSGNDEVQFFDLLELTVQNAFNSLLDIYGYKIFGTKKNTDGTVSVNSAISAKDPDGIYNALDTAVHHSPTYAVYGGLTRSEVHGDPGFAANANVVDAGNAPLSKPLLQHGYSTCVFNKKHPSIGICRRDLWNQLWERVETTDRNTAGGLLREAGFETIRFNGAEVTPDDHQAPGVFDWLTPEDWRLWVLEGRDLVRRASIYGMDAFPLPLQDRTVDQLVLSSNLVCAGPRTQCRILNIRQG